VDRLFDVGGRKFRCDACESWHILSPESEFSLLRGSLTPRNGARNTWVPKCLFDCSQASYARAQV
jgi:hypothetical protein